MAGQPIFDHVAVALARWSDGYDCFVRRFGGVWRMGGSAGAFAPAQFSFHDGMKVELLEPGEQEGNFVSRFLSAAGPGAHHLTWLVPDMDEFERGCHDLGLDVMPPFLDLPGHREAFVHPKSAGLGTLLQAIESAERHSRVVPAPHDVPPPGEPHEVCWVALQVRDLGLAADLFTGVLGGRERDRGHASGSGSAWTLIEWPVARRLLVFEDDSARSARCGVDHVMFAPVGRTLPDPADVVGRARPAADPAIGLPILEVSRVHN